MRIDETAPLLTAIPTSRVDKLLSAWRVGQVLDAVVVRVNNVGTATLNVNNSLVDVRSETPLTPGTKLILEVAQTQAQIALRILAAPQPKDPVAETLRALVPRQQPLAPALAQLAKIAAPAAATEALPTTPRIPAPAAVATPQSTPSPTLAFMPPPLLPTNTPAPLRELAKQVIGRISTPQQVMTEEGLKQAIKNAGPFFEHKLAMSQTQPEGSEPAFADDLKGGLLRLVALLKSVIPAAPKSATPMPQAPAPPSAAARPPAQAKFAAQFADVLPQIEALARDADAALARVTVHQLLSTPDRQGDPPQWVFELPIRADARVDIFHFHVYREKHPRDSKHPPAWCVRLSFDLVSLGSVGVLVTLLGGAVSVSIWAQESATAQLFQAHLAKLHSELRGAGVTVNRVHCECGAAPFSADSPLIKSRNRLIDEHA